ncbi:hypothetical protein NJH78_05440 [Pseudomonas chlororaphis]|uniref:hypothetical protein n=1 Tax=Pseudomonas chlororaphis TaxID=587753 RepID=UPI00209B3C26|nr:hypothetical protein [Pseudomonas chlororaphis]MCO7569410.1 hypothetical protein [Pseudomonas chlororaphis]MCO7586745.1 hypothetical protein [Pseudomonas chlororaphis]
MSNEMISAIEKALLAMKRIYQAGYDRIIECGGSCDTPDYMMESDPTVRELRALLANPDAGISASLSSLPRFDMDQTACEIPDPDGVWVRYDDIAAFLQHQGEPVAWEVRYRDDGVHQGFVTTQERADYYAKQYYKIVPLYTRPAEQPEPISSKSDKYEAELYDEVWQLARDMGFGNVTDALMKLQSQLQSEPPSYKPGLYAVRHIDNWDGERDIALTFANLDADGKWTDGGTGDALLAYRGDKILRAWPLDCSDAPGAQIIGVPRNWLEDWALELVEAAQDGGQMSNQVEHLLQLHPKQ